VHSSYDLTDLQFESRSRLRSTYIRRTTSFDSGIRQVKTSGDRCNNVNNNHCQRQATAHEQKVRLDKIQTISKADRIKIQISFMEYKIILCMWDVLDAKIIYKIYLKCVLYLIFVPKLLFLIKFE